MPDPDRPSGSPLSEADADRLSERFTASWEESEPEAANPPGSDPRTAPLAPLRSTVRLPTSDDASRPAAPTTVKAQPKHTLVGIAPIVVGPASPPKSAAPAPAFPKSTAPAPASIPAPSPPRLESSPSVTVAPSIPVAAPVPTTAAPAPVPPRPPTPLPPPPPAPVPPPPSSSPDPGSVAQGLTTPAKPYVPKDDPSTPAVVLSDAALADSEQAKLDRARTVATIPSQVRSSPHAITAPLGSTSPVASSPVVRSSPVASSPMASSALDASSLDDTYPPLRRRGSKAPAVVGALVLALVGGAAYLKLRPSSAEQPPRPAAPLAPADSEPVAPTPVVPVAPEEPSGPEPAGASSIGSIDAPASSPPAPVTEPPAGVARKGKPRKPLPPRRAPSKSDPKAASGPASAPEPAPAGKAGKGVIVRETPF